jgi:putative ABC transport system permease protein
MFRKGRFEAVVGASVARATGLSLGDEFQVTHGLVEASHVHDERWTVVGVLRPSGTAHDRALYIAIDRFYAMPGHDAGTAHADHDHGEEHEPTALSAIGIRLRTPALRLQYLHEFRTTRTDVQAVHPPDQMRKLAAIVGDVNRGVSVIAWLVTVVAALGILVGLYNTIHGRRREIALLRALGARAHHVFGVILLEAVVLCLLGGVAGILLGHAGLAAAAPTLLERYGVRVVPGLDGSDLTLLGGVVLLGLLAGILPAWRGLTTPVAENLEPEA